MTDAELQVLEGRIATRAGGVLRGLLRPHMWKVVADGAAFALKGWATGKAMDAIRADLKKRGQLS